MKVRLVSILFCCSLLVAVAGCRSNRSLLSPPGTVQQQRLNGTVHDPYPDDQAGPEVVGGRPRDYQRPWSEAHRSQSLWGG
jgi:hypothetical protein